MNTPWIHDYVEMDDHEKIAVWSSHNQGIPVILVHGFPENHLAWIKVIHHLQKCAPHKYRFIVYDLRGHGNSSKRGEASLQRFFQDHLCVVRAFNLDKYHLVGHDWGGAIGLHVSKFRPDQLMSLSVMNTNYWKTDLKGMWHLFFLNLPILTPMLFRFKPKYIYKLFLENSFFNRLCVDPETRKSYLDMFEDRDTYTYWIHLYKDMAKALIIQALPKHFKKYPDHVKTQNHQQSDYAFQVPTRLIWGADDTFNPLWVGRDIYERIKKKFDKVEFFEIKESGHFVNEEQPEECASLLINFWENEDPQI